MLDRPFILTIVTPMMKRIHKMACIYNNLDLLALSSLAFHVKANEKGALCHPRNIMLQHSQRTSPNTKYVHRM